MSFPSKMDSEELDELLDSLNSQTSDTDDCRDSDFSSDEASISEDNEPSTLLIDGMEYVESQNLAEPIRKSSAKKSSSIWKLGIQLKRVNDSVTFGSVLSARRQTSQRP